MRVPRPGRWIRGVASSVRRALTALFSRSQRQTLLILFGYVTGVGGLLLSLFGGPIGPGGRINETALALLGVSFLSLFLVSMSIASARQPPPGR